MISKEFDFAKKYGSLKVMFQDGTSVVMKITDERITSSPAKVFVNHLFKPLNSEMPGGIIPQISIYTKELVSADFIADKSSYQTKSSGVGQIVEVSMGACNGCARDKKGCQECGKLFPDSNLKEHIIGSGLEICM